MPNWMQLLLKDILDAIFGLRPVDFAFGTFITMWLIILFMPLIGVDRRDPIAGMVFSLYCVASGAALVFALPQELMGETDLKTINITLSCMAIAAAVRWVGGGKKKVFGKRFTKEV